METTKKSRKKSETGISNEKIRSAYKEFLLLNGKKPASIYKFCLDLGIKEND